MKEYFLDLGSFEDMYIFSVDHKYIQLFEDTRPRYIYNIEHYYSLTRTRSTYDIYELHKKFTKADYLSKTFRRKMIKLDEVDYFVIERLYKDNLCNHRKICPIEIYQYYKELFDNNGKR